MKPLCIAAVTALFAACSPDFPSGPVRLAVLVHDPDLEAYRMGVVTVNTLSDVAAMKGAAAESRVNATITFNPYADWETEQGIRDAFSMAGAEAPTAQFFEDGDGVFWPADFHSLNLATAYYNFELAREFFVDHGMPEQTLRGAKFYYEPASTLPEEIGIPVEDNAAWFPIVGGFILLRANRLQEVPLPMNLGVIAHEYSHGVFTHHVLGGAPLAVPFRWDSEGRGTAILMAVNEGFADAWAAGATGDPDFVAHSLSFLEQERSLQQTVCYSDLMVDPQDPYTLGTVYAAALWKAGQMVGTNFNRVLLSLFASYEALGLELQNDPLGSEFDVATPINALVLAAVDEPTKTALCGVFLDRFSSGLPSVPGCESITRTQDCP